MIRNLKALGLALVAILALGAVVASAASAQGELTTDGNSVTLDGKDIGAFGSESNYLEYPGQGKVECEGSTYTGHRVLTHEQTTLGSKHQALLPNDTKATITPHYGTICKVNQAQKATVTMNGCDLVLNVGETTVGQVDEYKVTADVECPPNKVIEVHVYFATSNENLLVCTVTVPQQTGITGLDIKNEVVGGNTNGTLELTGTATGIKASKHGLCGSSETNAATYKASVTIEGTNAEGGKTSVSVTD